MSASTALAWNRAHPERNRERARLWYAANNALVKARKAAFQRTPAGKAHRHAMRAKRRGAKGRSTAEQIAARVAFYGWRCYLCGEPWQEIDHVIPLARGGSHYPANLRPACRSCNRRKGAKRSTLHP